MSEQDVFVAAYMDACKNRSADWNDIGYWYARQLWDAALRYEREACLEAVLEVGRTTGDTPDMAEYCADAIRARAGLAAPPEE